MCLLSLVASRLHCGVFGHYDYWSDTVRRSILVDSKADILIYGMGELQIIELAEALDQNRFEESLPNIRGICYMSKDIPSIDCVECPSFEEIKADKMAFADAFRIQYDEQDPFYGRPIVQKHGDRYVVQNVPALPLTQEQMDAAYDLPYTRKWHPSYDDKGGRACIKRGAVLASLVNVVALVVAHFVLLPIIKAV